MSNVRTLQTDDVLDGHDEPVHHVTCPDCKKTVIVRHGESRPVCQCGYKWRILRIVAEGVREL